MATFTDAEYLTGNEKRLTVHQWDLLLRRSFDAATWARSGRVYHVCTMYLGHIAHYNQGGFYDAQLSSPVRRVGFLMGMRDRLNGYAESPPPAYADKLDLFQAMLEVLDRHYSRLVEEAYAGRIQELEAAKRAIEAELDSLRGAAA
jgi:hypothetical protein